MTHVLRQRTAVKITILALVISLVAVLAPRTNAGADEGDWENWCDTVVTNWFRPFLCDTLNIDNFSVDGLIDGFLTNNANVQDAACGILGGVGSFAGVDVGNAIEDLCNSQPIGQFFDDIVNNVNIDEVMIGIISLDLGKIADGLNFCAAFANYESNLDEVIDGILADTNIGDLINDAFIGVVNFLIPNIGPLVNVQNFIDQFINWLNVGGIAENLLNWLFVHLNIDNIINGIAGGIAMVLDLVGLCSPQTVDLTIEKDLLDVKGAADGPGSKWTFTVKGITDKCKGGAGPFEVTTDELGKVTIPDVWAAANQGETCEYMIKEGAVKDYKLEDVTIDGGEIIEETKDYVIVTLDRRADEAVVTFTNQLQPTTTTTTSTTTTTTKPGTVTTTTTAAGGVTTVTTGKGGGHHNQGGGSMVPPPAQRPGGLAFTGSGTDTLAAGGFLLLALGLLAMSGARLADVRRRK